MNERFGEGAKEAKRRQILSAAVDVFARKGFAGARTREIAEVAGVGEGTIYLYFQGKEDLLLSAFRETVTEFCRSIRGVLASDIPFLDRLETFIRVQFERIEAEPALATVLLLESRQTTTFYSGAVRDELRTYAAAIDELLASGIADGSVRPDAPLPLVRRMLIGSIEEIELEWLLGDRSRRLVADARPLAETLVFGIAAVSR